MITNVGENSIFIVCWFYNGNSKETSRDNEHKKMEIRTKKYDLNKCMTKESVLQNSNSVVS